jgi:hypothetical protein
MLRFKNAYELMRELTILSVNIILVKEGIQKTERFKANILYLNISVGPLDILLLDLQKRKRSLQNRFKILYEIDLLEANPARNDLFLVITTDQTGWKRRELEEGYSFIYDIYETRYLVDLRTGIIYNDTTENIVYFAERNTKLFMGAVYDYFKVDMKNPLIGKDLRY